VIEIGGQEVCTIEKLDEIIARLRMVAFLEKILPSDHNDLVDAVKCIRDLIAVITVPAPEVLAEGVLTADGTVQTVVEAEGLGLYYGLLRLDKMDWGDQVVIETWVRVVSGGEWIRYARMEYAGSQKAGEVFWKDKGGGIVPVDPALVWFPVFARYGFKVTLQQVAGVYRTFEYGFYRRL